jgi:hypothetical protein
MTETQRRRPRPGHFTEEAWADFVRGQGEPEQRARLEQHLDAGCERCAETLGVWTAVVGLTGQEASYQPPEGVVTRMKGQLALSRPERLIERAVRSASLIFDSFRQPALAGVRAAGASPRHLLYKAGRYLIRLQVEREAGSDRLSVVGQIVDEANPQNALEDLPVLLMSNKETLDRTLTNTLGEFHLKSDPSEDLRLSVGIPEIGTLTLPGLLAGAAGLGGADVLGMRGGLGRRTRARHP